MNFFNDKDYEPIKFRDSAVEAAKNGIKIMQALKDFNIEIVWKVLELFKMVAEKHVTTDQAFIEDLLKAIFQELWAPITSKVKETGGSLSDNGDTKVVADHLYTM
jgi:hypothetical protein